MNEQERWLDRMVGFKPDKVYLTSRAQRRALGIKGKFIGKQGRSAWTPPRRKVQS